MMTTEDMRRDMELAKKNIVKDLDMLIEMARLLGQSEGLDKAKEIINK